MNGPCVKSQIIESKEHIDLRWNMYAWEGFHSLGPTHDSKERAILRHIHENTVGMLGWSFLQMRVCISQEIKGKLTREDEYQDWINANVDGDGYGQCAEITEAMAKLFPELTRVRGHYYCPVWGERPHWWLTTPEGKIVDPTAAQHPSGGLGHYEPWDESKEEPTGKCPNCGGYAYKGKTCCSEECSEEYRSYIEGELGNLNYRRM